MKFTSSRKELSEVLRIISRAVPAKPDIPILSGIYFETTDKGLMLQSTDNQTGFICHIPAQIEEPGKVVVTAKYILDMVNKLPGANVEFNFDTGTNIVTIKSDNANFTLLSTNPDDFPAATPLEEGTTFTINNNILFNLIRKTSFACSTDKNRPLFTGCNLSINDDELTMVATNTHRLAVKKEKITGEGNNLNLTIPSKVLNDLTQINLNNEEDFDIKITCAKNKIEFSFNDNYIYSGIISGEYPDYKRAVPKSFDTNVEINVNEFREAIERAALISRTNEYNIIKMRFADNKVNITSQNPEIGKAEETVNAKMEGAELNIAFNAQYMIDILKITDTKTIKMGMNTSISPISITEEDDDSFLYISTPVRTAD